MTALGLLRRRRALLNCAPISHDHLADRSMRAAVFTFQVLGRLNDFPGSATARKLLTVAGSTRSVTLDPVSAEAGTLSDLFFMKHGLEHYDVPEEFAVFRTIGCRVFDDDESQRIAQIWVAEKRMQFFL